MDRNNSQPIQRGRPVSGMDAAYGNEYFEQFLNASSLKHILGYYRGLIDNLHLKPNVFPLFYPKLRANLTSWKAKALWKKFDARSSHKCYQKGKAASNTRVLIIGAGPCGLRAAIEAQLLGAKVVVIEKRDRFSRNNVLHLWPFVIEDLRMLGAKKFFGKFCAGAIDHISIRRLQCILLKVALLLGVEVHTEVSFEKLIEPNATEKTGWRAEIKPINHPVSQYEFDVIIGADGKRNTLQGFTRKEFRGKLAIAITANFINKKTEAEARVEEISGVAFIFNQKFFKDLQEETRIDLENIVYYKDDTHYFVMTAKKASLIEKGVIKQDLADTEKLLAPENVDREALENYAIEAANFSTNYQMPDLEFAVNHYGHPDIAMFDFTSMFAADNASKVVERNGYRLLMILVGDSLLEPFWPTGSGCARGFLSSLDAAWAIRSWSMGTTTPLDVLAERESIYRLLAQTTPDNLNKDWKSYTLDPATRYPNLNKAVLLPHQTVSLYDTDNPTSIERMKRNSQEKSIEVPKKRRRGNVDNEVLLNWISEQLRDHEDINVTDIGSIFKNGKVLCAIIHHYRPDLLDYNSVKDSEPAKSNQLAFDILEKELGIPPIMTGEEITSTEDYLTMASYLTLVYDSFRGEIPHIKQPKLKVRSKIPKSLALSQVKSSSTSNKMRDSNGDLKHSSKSSKIEKFKTKLLEKLQTKTRDKDLSLNSDNMKNESKSLNHDIMSNTGPSKSKEIKKKKIKTVKTKLCIENSRVKLKKRSKIRMPRTEDKKSANISILDTISKEETEKQIINNNKIYNIGENINTANDHKEVKLIKMHKSCISKLAKEPKLGYEKGPSIKKNVKFVDLKARSEHSDTKIDSQLALKKRKVKQKKSKLSVIPEVKYDLAEDKVREKTLHTSHSRTSSYETTNNQLPAKEYLKNSQEYIKTSNMKNDKSVLENNVKNCETIFNNHCYENSEKSYLGVYSGLSKKIISNEIKEKATVHTILNYPSDDTMVKIRLIEKKSKNKFMYQKIEFVSSLNLVTISSKACVSKKPNRYTTSYNQPVNYKLFSESVKKLQGNSLNNKSSNIIPKLKSRRYYKIRYPQYGHISVDFGESEIEDGNSGILKALNTDDQKILHELGSRDFPKYLPNYKCHIKLQSHKCKFPSKNMTMSEGDGLPDQIYSRVSNWISSHDFQVRDNGKMDAEGETIISNDIPSDITSVTRTMAKKKGEYDDIIIEERTDVVKCRECESPVSSEESFSELMKNINNNKSVRTLSKFSQYSPFQNSGNLKSASAPPTQFSVIVEGEESDLPESNKRSELSFKTIKTSNMQALVTNQPSRPSSRHKRHADAMIPNKVPSIDRKTRKRRTLERVGASVEERQKMLEEISSNRMERQNKRRQQRKLQTEQFLKSMQMLQANALDSQPFEDYSIFLYRQTAPKFEDRVKDLEKQFTYVPDHESKAPNLASRGGGTDEDLAARIKSLENKWREPQPIDKKPKDLLRAIGKIETSDWNIKEIEKKIMENKLGKPSKAYDKEKVPKWSKEQFLARQTKMEKQHLDRQDSAEAKFADIDRSIKHLDQKLKEGSVRELGQNKVAFITEKLVSKVPPEPKQVEKNNIRPPSSFAIQGGSEFCHFCGKRVYLMERLSAEGRFFHHGCFKCQYCHTQLRLGSYAFDRDGQYGHKFFCIHHYGMIGEITPAPKVTRKPSQRTARESRISPEKKPLSGVAGVDLLDRVQTPERIEFSNLSGNISSDQEESLSQMDEDEWTDKNFGASCAEMGDSEDDSSSLSDTESDDEDAFDDALEEPVTKEGTMKWAERWKNSYSRKRHDSDSNGYSSSDQSSYYENSSDDDDSDTATEGEDEIRARELRKQEVRVEPPVVQTDTGTDTEVVSDESSSESSSEIQNSATEISTDSEFAHDDPTPTREIPAIVLNDFNVTKVRGSGGNIPKKIQVTSGYLQKPSNGKAKKTNIELKLKPLVPSAPTIKKPAPVLFPRTEGYALNRTQSTGGIAAKVSLELKKKYLLGESIPGSIQKSGSASTLDSKFKTFHDTISDCQKLLKPAPEISASMQTFCNKLNERHSPILSPQSSVIFNKAVENKPEELKEKLPPPDVTNVKAVSEEVSEPVFQNESEGRPRSPVHETSIIVPKIDWNKKNLSNSSDSLCTSSSDNELVTSPNHQFDNIPRVEVHAAKEHDSKDNLPPDSLSLEVQSKSKIENSFLQADPPKSITSEKKTLNQPKSLPNVEIILPEIHNSLHINLDKTDLKKSSGFSSPDSGAEQATAALTETELSDWARDGAVSDDFEDVEFDFHQVSKKTYKDIKEPQTPIQIATIQEFDDVSHICGKEKQDKDCKNKAIITDTVNSILNENLDSIEFMDTGTETSSDDGIVDSQDGYVLFKDEDDFAEDSLNPNINEIIDTKNIYVDDKFSSRNTGYCILACDDKGFPETGADLKHSDLEKLKQKQLAEPEEDSLLIVETGTTTEENTCSDSTVKNITEISLDKNQLNEGKLYLENDNLQKQRLEEKLTKVKDEAALEEENKKLQEPFLKESAVDSNIEFEEHCQRLQSKVEFGNVKDSIDIRKSRRKSKSDSPQKPDLIQEEKSSSLHSTKDITLNLTPTTHTPDILHKKEILKKERDINQKLIQEMVMNKMKAENKSLERKKRNKSTHSNASDPYELCKSMSTDVSTINLDNSNRNSIYSTGSSTYATPDVLLSTNLIPLQNSQSVNTVPDINSSSDIFSTPLSSLKEQNSKPLCVNSAFAEKKLEELKLSQHSENFSMPEVRTQLFSEDSVTPNPPPRQHRLLKDEANKTAEKLKKDAKAKAKLLSNEELGLSPEEKLLKLREKINKRGKGNENVDPHIQESIESLIMNTERKNSWLYSNDTLSKKKNNSFKRSKSSDCATPTSNSKPSTYNYPIQSKNILPVRTKSISEFTKNLSTAKPEDAQSTAKKICQSDPNLLDTVHVKPKKKSKDHEQRKSITKLISTLFTKKSPNNTSSKRLFSKLSPKSKDISKSCANLDLNDDEIVVEEPIRRKSLSDVFVHRNISTPPPIPPLPLNYTVKGTDDSSDGEHEWRKQDRSSCDTLDQSGMLENSTSSLTGRKANKSTRRVARQAQLKRHRMAQEIQRKLEETEVKTRELEARGVLVEKILRGEDSGECSKDESELLQEWFDLMRDLTELRRYEKELMVRAQELELEDRHARLQHELRERLENNELKTEEDVMAEEFIINEMMEIVAKRDSLIAVIEEDRLRYSHEDRDLEEQMLAKGLRLTPIRKSP